MNIIDFEGIHRGFRAEHIIIGNINNLGAGYNFTLTTDFAEPVGAETYLYGLNEHGDKITVRVNGLYETTMGDVLSCHVLDSHLHHFDKVSGKRIKL
jgi:hypothetical protein